METSDSLSGAEPHRPIGRLIDARDAAIGQAVVLGMELPTGIDQRITARKAPGAAPSTKPQSAIPGTEHGDNLILLDTFPEPVGDPIIAATPAGGQRLPNSCESSKPHRSVGRLTQRQSQVITKPIIGVFAGEGLEGVPIVARNPAVGSEPDRPIIRLVDIAHCVCGQPIGRRVIDPGLAVEARYPAVGGKPQGIVGEPADRSHIVRDQPIGAAESLPITTIEARRTR